MRELKLILLILGLVLAPLKSVANPVQNADKLPSVNFIKNPGFERGRPGIKVYDDGSSSVPVDGNGGTASVLTIANTSTDGEVLRPAYSLKITKTASSCQGEGISIPFEVPLGYRTSTVSIEFLFKVLSGSIVEDEFIPSLIDVDDSRTPIPAAKHQQKIVGTQGRYIGKFFLNNTTSNDYELVIHCASTSTTAVTLSIDDILAGPHSRVSGMAGSNWESVTVTGSWTTNTTYTAKRRRAGDMAFYQVAVSLSGAPNSASLTITLPSGDVIDTDKLASTSGDFNLPFSSGNLADTGLSGRNISAVLYSTNTTVQLTYDDGNGQHAPITQAAPFTFGAGDTVFASFAAPIQGWDANVNMEEGSVFYAEDIATTYKSTGPTKLGEYTSYIRGASGTTYTASSPTTAPNHDDGFLLYGGEPWATADPANEPSRYKIYVGKNRPSVRVSFYSSTGKTGAVSVAPNLQGAVAQGVRWHYDKSTGILEVAKYTSGSATTAQYCGASVDGNTSVSNCYFSVQVSRDAMPIGVENTAVTSSGSNGRGEWAYITNDGSTCAISSQNGSWISSVSRPATGQCTLTIASGIFSQAPVCFPAVVIDASINRTETCRPVSGATTTSLTVKCENTAGQEGLDRNFNILCMGPR